MPFEQHTPVANGKFLILPNLYGLKQVLHANACASEAGRKFYAHLLETWRPEANRRISREAKALFRDSDPRIELAIGVLVMNDGERIATDRDIPEFDAAHAGRNGKLQGLGIVLAMREMSGIAGHARLDRPARAAQGGQVHLDRGRWRRCGELRGNQKLGKSKHARPAYQWWPPLAKWPKA